MVPDVITKDRKETRQTPGAAGNRDTDWPNSRQSRPTTPLIGSQKAQPEVPQVTL